MTNDELSAAAKAMRGVASKVGPLHAYWDVIFDIEATVQGRPSILSRDTLVHVTGHALQPARKPN